MKIVVTGRSGQVGCELAGRMPTFADSIFLDRQSLDLSDTQGVAAMVRRLQPLS